MGVGVGGCECVHVRACVCVCVRARACVCVRAIMVNTVMSGARCTLHLFSTIYLAMNLSVLIKGNKDSVASPGICTDDLHLGTATIQHSAQIR